MINLLHTDTPLWKRVSSFKIGTYFKGLTIKCAKIIGATAGCISGYCMGVCLLFSMCFEGLLLAFVAVFFLWLFFPDFDGTGKVTTYYVLESKECPGKGCTYTPLAPMTYSINIDTQEVVWQRSDTNAISKYSDCLIIDKNNWSCPHEDYTNLKHLNHRMTDGVAHPSPVASFENGRQKYGVPKYKWKLSRIGFSGKSIIAP